MSQNLCSEESESPNGKRPSFESLRLCFENSDKSNLSKSKSFSHLALPISANIDNIYRGNQLQRRVSQTNEYDVIDTTGLLKNLEKSPGLNVTERPPLPQRRENLEVLLMRTSRRTEQNITLQRSATMRYPFINMVEEGFEQDQTDVAISLPPKIHKTLNDLSHEDKPNNSLLPTPQPRRRSTIRHSKDESNPSLSISNQQTISKKMSEIDNVPKIPPRRFSDDTKCTEDDPGIKNSFVVLTDYTGDANEIPVNILPVRPKSIYIEREHNKGAIKRSQTMSPTTRANAYQKTVSFEEKITNSVELPLNTPIYENLPTKYPDLPPLPPKSLYVQALASSSQQSSPGSPSSILNFKRNSSDLDVVQKLHEVKAIFTSADMNQSDRLNEIILLLIDIILETIKERLPSEEEDNKEDQHSALYSIIKDLVHCETEKYIRENQLLNNNLNCPYGKLLNKMVPKLIENYNTTDTDHSPNQINGGEGEEDNYEKVCEEKGKDNKTVKPLYVDTSEKVLEILNDTKQSEKSFLETLRSNIHEFIPKARESSLEEDVLFDMFYILRHIFTMQYEFITTLETSGNDLNLIVKTFLDSDDLFTLYVEFFRRKIRISNGSNGSASEDYLLNLLKNLSDLFLSRLATYRFLIKNIEQVLVNEKENESAEAAKKMLKAAMERCHNAEPIATNHNDNSLVDPELESLLDNSQGDTTKFLANLIPTKTYDSNGYGLFLLSNKFKVDNHRNYFTIFLFEKVIILTKEISKENYVYKDCLKMNQLVLLPEGKNKKALKLKHYVKSKSSGKDVFVTLETRSEETQTTWRTEINRCLWTQLIQEKEESKRLSIRDTSL